MDDYNYKSFGDPYGNYSQNDEFDEEEDESYILADVLRLSKKEYEEANRKEKEDIQIAINKSLENTTELLKNSDTELDNSERKSTISNVLGIPSTSKSMKLDNHDESKKDNIIYNFNDLNDDFDDSNNNVNYSQDDPYDNYDDFEKDNNIDDIDNQSDILAKILRQSKEEYEDKVRQEHDDIQIAINKSLEKPSKGSSFTTLLNTAEAEFDNRMKANLDENSNRPKAIRFPSNSKANFAKVENLVASNYRNNVNLTNTPNSTFVNSHQTRVEYPCDICYTQYESNYHLKKHIERVHEGKKPIKRQNIDKDGYFNNQYYKRMNPAKDPSIDEEGYFINPLNKVKKTKDFECGTCFKRFVSKQNMRKHIEKFHKGNKPPKEQPQNINEDRIMNHELSFKMVYPSAQTLSADDQDFQMVQNHFLSMLPKNSQRIISSVEFVTNPVLKKKYDDKKLEFKNRNIPDHEIFAYHGTQPKNVKSICKSNLNIIRRTAHGNGYYFTEYPEMSLSYGAGLILFKLLPGYIYDGPRHDLHIGQNSQYNR